VFSTGNPTKAKRFLKKLLKNSIEAFSLKDLKINIEIKENGKDAIEKALIKVKLIIKKLN